MLTLNTGMIAFFNNPNPQRVTSMTLSRRNTYCLYHMQPMLCGFPDRLMLFSEESSVQMYRLMTTLPFLLVLQVPKEKKLSNVSITKA